jgi:hypothetical protein
MNEQLPRCECDLCRDGITCFAAWQDEEAARIEAAIVKGYACQCERFTPQRSRRRRLGARTVAVSHSSTCTCGCLGLA